MLLEGLTSIIIFTIRANEAPSFSGQAPGSDGDAGTRQHQWAPAGKGHYPGGSVHWQATHITKPQLLLVRCLHLGYEARKENQPRFSRLTAFLMVWAAATRRPRHLLYGFFGVFFLSSKMQNLLLYDDRGRKGKTDRNSLLYQYHFSSC